MNMKTSSDGAPAAPVADRTRLTIDLPPGLLLLLDRFAETTGQSRTQVVLALLAEQLPALDDRASDLRNRVAELERQRREQQQRQGGGKR